MKIGMHTHFGRVARTTSTGSIEFASISLQKDDDGNWYAKGTHFLFCQSSGVLLQPADRNDWHLDLTTIHEVS